MLMTADDKALAPIVPFIDPRIRRAASGDRAAAQTLLREILPRVRNLVRYLVRGDSEVEDMAQQALLAVLRGLPTYRGQGKWLSWVDRITAREALAYQKKRRLSQKRAQDMTEDLTLMQPPGLEPDAYLNRRDLVRSLDRLPIDQRSAVVFHYVLGMSVPELADHLGIPFDTAKSRVRLGMKKLRASHHE
jgi:RNA polymerase sigma-70 factor, ECF subfamily